MADADLRVFATELNAVLLAGGVSPSDRSTIARSVVQMVAAAAGWEVPPALAAAGPVVAPAGELTVPSELCSPRLLGELYESTLDPGARSAGSHYTPADVAAGLVGLAWSRIERGRDDPTVWDPACGGGAFLLAAGDRLLEDGWSADQVLGRLWGTDTDPGAVAVAEASLAWWAELNGGRPAPSAGNVTSADSLLERRPGPPEGFTLVVGNPPFQGQLTGRAIRGADEREALRERFGSVVGPYTDTSSLFMVLGVDALAPGGAMAMVVPSSLLSARDAEAARRRVTETVDLVGLWVAVEPVFEASVDVCAPVVVRPSGSPGSGPRPVVVGWRGRTFEGLGAVETAKGRVEPVPASWSPLALRALGVPDHDHRAGGTLAEICRGAGAFRDEYYGLVDHVSDTDVESMNDLPVGQAPLITSGLVDPGRCRWGERPARFARRLWERPVVDVVALERAGGKAASWVRSTARPKVVVASQTRVGEAAVDQDGRWVVSTPAVVLTTPPDRLWEIAAVVCSPVATAVLLAGAAGTARSVNAIRPTVELIGNLPLPVDHEAWGEGAEALRRGDMESFASAMALAYGRTGAAELEEWWASRLPASAT